MLIWADSIRYLALTTLTLLATSACVQEAENVPPAPVRNDAPVAHDAPLSMQALANLRVDTVLTRERSLDETASFSAYLVSYRYADLKLHAMVAVPKTAMPVNGYPVVIANHGYVPDPTKYGISKQGGDSRPGDYYRSVPALFASRGFLVVLPDYRGHNSSDGLDFIDPQDEHSIGYYAEDVVALMSALDTLDKADLNNAFMWSHSMGGPVALRAMLASHLVKASSFWATMSVDDLAPHVASLTGPVAIHHSIEDESTDHANSVALGAVLEAADHPFTLYSYRGGHHYFDKTVRELAADRDAVLFRSLITPSSPAR